jgi:alpha-glucosidase
LGVDAVWLSPIFPSPMEDMGYDVSDYVGVDPLFGSLADFDRLLARAHGLGLKVIIDQVLSHSSDRHPWFHESRMSRDNPKADWYVWADPLPDGRRRTTGYRSSGLGLAWESRRRQYYLHNFLASQPDLNYHNPACRTRRWRCCASGWSGAWTGSASTRSTTSSTIGSCAPTRRRSGTTRCRRSTRSTCRTRCARRTSRRT